MRNLNKAQSQFLTFLSGHGKPDSDELYELIELAKSLEMPNKIIGEMRIFRDKLANVSSCKGQLKDAKQEAIDQWSVVKGIAESDGDLVDQAIEAEQGHDEPKQYVDDKGRLLFVIQSPTQPWFSTYYKTEEKTLRKLPGTGKHNLKSEAQEELDKLADAKKWELQPAHLAYQEPDEWDLQTPDPQHDVQETHFDPDAEAQAKTNTEAPKYRGCHWYDPTLPTSPHDCGARFLQLDTGPGIHPKSYHVEKHPFGLTYRICAAEYDIDGNHTYRTVQLGDVAMFDTPQEAFGHLAGWAEDHGWERIDTVKAEVEA